MRVISVLNLKGGVAKTFTAANVAYELCTHNAVDTYAKRGNHKRSKKLCKYPIFSKSCKHAETRGYKERAQAFYRGQFKRRQ